MTRPRTRSSKTSGGTTPRRLPVGAEVVGGGVHFRVWAPGHTSAVVVLESGAAAGEYPLDLDSDGYVSALVPGAAAGDRYRYHLDGKEWLADPASRYQPEGPAGPSQVIDPAAFAWTDAGWKGLNLRGQVIYELHVGTFTQEGTWAAAARELPALADLGVTVIEVMPVADFPGRFGWGYDGVCLFAPYRAVRHPRRHAARSWTPRHAVGVGVILDVVYNHLGPRRQLPGPVHPGLLHRPVPHRLGPGDQLRRPRQRPGPRVLPGQRRLLDRRVPPRRPPARRDAVHLRRLRRPHPRADRAAGARGRPRPGHHRHQRERAAGGEDRAARASAAGTGWTGCGTTTSTTPRWSR